MLKGAFLNLSRAARFFCKADEQIVIKFNLHDQWLVIPAPIGMHIISLRGDGAKAHGRV